MNYLINKQSEATRSIRNILLQVVHLCCMPLYTLQEGKLSGVNIKCKSDLLMGVLCFPGSISFSHFHVQLSKLLCVSHTLCNIQDAKLLKSSLFSPHRHKWERQRSQLNRAREEIQSSDTSSASPCTFFTISFLLINFLICNKL